MKHQIIYILVCAGITFSSAGMDQKPTNSIDLSAAKQASNQPANPRSNQPQPAALLATLAATQCLICQRPCAPQIIIPCCQGLLHQDCYLKFFTEELRGWHR